MAIDSFSFFLLGEGELVELNLEQQDDSENEKEEKTLVKHFLTNEIEKA